MTARASVQSFTEGEDLREEDVTLWLRRAGALRASGQTAAPTDAAGTENASSEVAAWPDLSCGYRANPLFVSARHDRSCTLHGMDLSA